MASKDRRKDSKSKSYSEEFKRSAVELVTHQKYSIAGAARAVGVSEPSMRNWLAKFAPDAGEAGEATTLEQLQEENKRLRRALKRAELEREILKKATVFFAQEST